MTNERQKRQKANALLNCVGILANIAAKGLRQLNDMISKQALILGDLTLDKLASKDEGVVGELAGRRAGQEVKDVGGLSKKTRSSPI